MIRKFKVLVNGQPFEVVVEEELSPGVVPKSASPPAPAAAQQQQTPPSPSVAPEPKPAAPQTSVTVNEGGIEVTAPIPGSIVAIKVQVGDRVNEGDTLIILEAMKMENEVSAPASGTVKAINVAVGASVNTGDVMMVLE